jgi:uncharacterized membrane protein
MRKLWPGLLANVAATLFAVRSYSRLPERVASHWDMNGAVNGTMSRFWLVLLMPVLAVVLAASLTIAPKLDPKRRNFPLHAGAYWVVTNAVLLFLALVHVLVIGYNLGWPIQLQVVMMPGLGLLFIVIGNVLTRVRPNWIFGIRTPWTLSSEVSWRETHRIGGYGFVAAGVAVVITSLVAPATAIYVMIIGIASATLLAVVWSYVAWKRDPNAQGRDA